MKKRKTAARKCSECIHEYACGAWNVGSLHDADATGCANYETLRDSTAYFIGFMEGQNSIYNGEKIERSKTW